MADGGSVCARPGGRAAARDRGVAGEGRDRGRPGVAGAVTARHGRAGMVLLARLPRERAAGVFQSRKTKARPVPASGPGGRGCVPGVPAPVRTAGSSAAAPVDQEGGHGERHEDAPWAVSAMAGAVPEAAALPRPGAWNVSFPVARLRRPHRMTDTPRPGRAGGRRPARTSGPSLSCRSPRIRACRSSGRSSRRRPAGRGPVRSGARCRSSRRASPRPASSRWHRTSRTAARGRPASRPGRAEALLRSRSLTCGPPAAGPSPAPAALPCADAPGGGPRRAASRRSARSRSSSCRPRSGSAPAPAGTPRRGRDGRSPRPEPDGRRSSTRPAGPDASGACRRPCARSGGRSRPPGPGDARRTPSGPRGPSRAAGRRGRPRIAAAEAAGAGPVAPLAHPRVRRRLPHAEERAQVPRLDRILAAPHLPAGLQKRRDPGREDREPRRQASRKAEVARAGRVGDAVEACTHGAKHGPGIDGCLRKESPDICCPAFACLAAARPIRRERSVTGKFVTAAQPTDNERKEILSGIAVARQCLSLKCPRRALSMGFRRIHRCLSRRR